MTAAVIVARAGDGVFEVSVREGASETRHRVALSQEDQARLAPGATAEELLEAAFRFLLDREPKESILAAFEISLIPRYFPEFEKTLPAYLAR